MELGFVAKMLKFAKIWHMEVPMWMLLQCDIMTLYHSELFFFHVKILPQTQKKIRKEKWEADLVCPSHNFKNGLERLVQLEIEHQFSVIKTSQELVKTNNRVFFRFFINPVFKIMILI